VHEIVVQEMVMHEMEVHWTNDVTMVEATWW